MNPIVSFPVDSTVHGGSWNDYSLCNSSTSTLIQQKQPLFYAQYGGQDISNLPERVESCCPGHWSTCMSGNVEVECGGGMLAPVPLTPVDAFVPVGVPAETADVAVVTLI